jgi:phospholipid/cholesterol/gamma-HCH transport system substrate-binding protein
METKVNYTVVGIFVVMLFSAIIFSVIWLSAGFSSQGYNIYKVYMSESVSGLSIDSDVEFNGVDIGNVTNMHINKRNPRLVELLLKIQSGTPITEGTRATLKAKGITGTAFIALQDKGNDLTPLSKAPGESYPVIKTAPSLFLRLDTALSDLATNMKLITAEVKTVLNAQNQKAFKQTLINMRNITNTIAANNQQLTSILQNSANIMQAFDQQTLPAANQALANISSVTRNLSDFSLELKRNPTLLIRGRSQPLLGPGEK